MPRARACCLAPTQAAPAAPGGRQALPAPRPGSCRRRPARRHSPHRRRLLGLGSSINWASNPPGAVHCCGTVPDSRFPGRCSCASWGSASRAPQASGRLPVSWLLLRSKSCKLALAQPSGRLPLNRLAPRLISCEASAGSCAGSGPPAGHAQGSERVCSGMQAGSQCRQAGCALHAGGSSPGTAYPPSAPSWLALSSADASCEKPAGSSQA